VLKEERFGCEECGTGSIHTPIGDSHSTISITSLSILIPEDILFPKIDIVKVSIIFFFKYIICDSVIQSITIANVGILFLFQDRFHWYGGVWLIMINWITILISVWEFSFIIEIWIRM
jgi:hypothetical protein